MRVSRRNPVRRSSALRDPRTSLGRTLASAVAGLLVSPQGATGRRQALASLWGRVRRGGEVSAFAGTPLHPGALRYYKEIGVTVPASMQ